MNDKHFRNFALVIGSAGLLYWLYRRKLAKMNAEPVAPDTSGETPEQIVYSSNPGAFGPAPVNTITIANQGLNYLNSQYIPLFGFVGMANGVTFQ